MYDTFANQKFNNELLGSCFIKRDVIDIRARKLPENLGMVSGETNSSPGLFLSPTSFLIL
jgi:hypothetical protein